MILKAIIIIFSFSLTSQCFANKLSLGLVGASYSKTITGEDSATNTTGEIVSNSNLNFGVAVEYSLSQSLRLIMGHQSRSVDFDNTDSVINGETAFDTSASSFGFRWILFSRMALRFLYNIEKDIGFEVVDDKAEVFVEDSSYLSIFYDQILFLGASMYSGFRVGVDILGSGSQIENRTATRYGGFITMNSVVGQLEAFYEIKQISKESSSLDFIEKDSILHLSYRLIF